MWLRWNVRPGVTDESPVARPCYQLPRRACTAHQRRHLAPALSLPSGVDCLSRGHRSGRTPFHRVGNRSGRQGGDDCNLRCRRRSEMSFLYHAISPEPWSLPPLVLNEWTGSLAIVRDHHWFRRVLLCFVDTCSKPDLLLMCEMLCRSKFILSGGAQLSLTRDGYCHVSNAQQLLSKT